jgi:hypothetical protein
VISGDGENVTVMPSKPKPELPTLEPPDQAAWEQWLEDSVTRPEPRSRRIADDIELLGRRQTLL